jgi:WD40 repeat protein
MDGPRVIYSSDDNAVHVWNIRSGAVTLLRRGAGKFTDNPTIQEVAIAGSRTAWITLASAGNSQETWARLFTGSLATLSGHKIASAFRVDGYDQDAVEHWSGDWVSGIAGSGDVLAVSRWTTTPRTDASGLTISNARLSLIERGRNPLRVIASGAKSIVSAAVDGRRIAVLRPDDSIGIYSSKGLLVREITPGSAMELAFGGGRVVVLTNTKTLEVYDAGTGELLHTWRIPVSAPYVQPGHLSAYGRIGVYVVDARYLASRLHVIDLASGKEVVLPASDHGVRDAVVGPLGLVYAVNKMYFGVKPPRRTGTFVFLTSKRVLAGIAKGRLK